MRIHAGCVFLASLMVAGCVQSPPVDSSRDQMWARYDHQPVDKLLMDLGPPDRESRMTDGSRMLTYHFASDYDYGSPYENASGCEATFIARAPRYRLENIAMKGNAHECSQLAQGRTGTVQYPYVPPPTPFMPGLYYSPYYRR